MTFLALMKSRWYHVPSTSKLPVALSIPVFLSQTRKPATSGFCSPKIPNLGHKHGLMSAHVRPSLNPWCLQNFRSLSRAASSTCHHPAWLTWCRLHHHDVLFALLFAKWATHDSTRALRGSLNPSLLVNTLRLSQSIGMNIPFDLHHASSTTMLHSTHAHHKPRDTLIYTILLITPHSGVIIHWSSRLLWYFLSLHWTHMTHPPASKIDHARPSPLLVPGITPRFYPLVHRPWSGSPGSAALLEPVR